MLAVNKKAIITIWTPVVKVRLPYAIGSSAKLRTVQGVIMHVISKLDEAQGVRLI